MLLSNNIILNDDLKNIYINFKNKKYFKNSNIVIIGCSGFLGFYFSTFFIKFSKHLKLKKLTLVDKFPNGLPNWVKKNKKNNNIIVKKIDITKKNLNLSFLKNVTFIIHAATFASPIYYRKFPLETLEANIFGIKSISNYLINNKVKIKGFLFFSSSEIYGDPDKKNIPTSEKYNGNVSPIGPRACYDESKRLGETLCWIYSNYYNLPITVVRPFNNYGPGMKLNDGRLPADLCKNIISNKDIILYSNGKPTRTFCYVSDAINGYLRALIYGKFEVFNIGNTSPEISVFEFSKKFVSNASNILGYNKKLKFKLSKDRNYLTNNPSRRCPNINKAKKMLGFSPKVDLDTGISRYLKFMKTNDEY